MRINRIDHFNIRTRDLDRLCEFYTQVLGLEIGERPPFDSPGVWLYAGGHPILHVGVSSDDDATKRDDTLPLDHIALETEGLADAVARPHVRCARPRDEADFRSRSRRCRAGAQFHQTRRRIRIDPLVTRARKIFM